MTDDVEQLRRLVRTSRGKGRLDPAPAREAIAVAVSEALPTSDAPGGGGGGYVSPLTEQSRTTTTVTVTDTSDPTFSIDFDVATQITATDAEGTELVINLSPV